MHETMITGRPPIKGNEVAVQGLNLPNYDYVSVAYPNDTTETYSFKQGGSSGAIVSVVTVVFTDSTKENLSSVTKS